MHNVIYYFEYFHFGMIGNNTLTLFVNLAGSQIQIKGGFVFQFDFF